MAGERRQAEPSVQLTPAHAHNAVASVSQMYGAALVDKQAECDALRANVALKEAFIEVQASQLREMQERIRAGTEENKKLIARQTESRLSVDRAIVIDEKSYEPDSG
jgi:hypothetical protein